ncbi:MAG TPA: iron-sulfur cluster assembly accessory protein [Dehalococcoidia bacterium]|nr:iron-sulfur cluster assembly accessory protein [Dehalococcoidia bacterium]
MTGPREASPLAAALFTVTPVAAEQARRVLHERGRPDATLRVFLAARRGNGFQYGLALAGEPEADDLAIEAGGVRFIVDLVSAPFLSGVTVDYVAHAQGRGFVISGPAGGAGGCACGRGGCGCGRR